MFSIAAINDTDSRPHQWEPLAPTKEAQESHLSQTYHEALLKLQDKDYAKARELFEEILKDPLISASQVSNSSSDGHLLQLRFLSLKNLATVFLQQGSAHYENALRCYIQAVEIDTADSVIWNHLGTLSCSMGLFSTSRWAFEQGLLCSPNNWNCMEKLLEVLIAIGDEVACLSVAHMILKHWPSHSRALHAKTTIQNAEPIPFAPRGIDKLEANHNRLKFPDKRKAADDEIDENAISKRQKQSIELQLSGATWTILTDAILGILLHSVGSVSNHREHDDFVNGNVDNKQGKAICGNAHKDETLKKVERYSDIKIDIHLCTDSDTITDQIDGKGLRLFSGSEGSSLTSCGFEKTCMGKEKEISGDKEHQERRSTRLERLRSRKSGKEESEISGKDLARNAFRFLEPFILNRTKTERRDFSVNSLGSYPDKCTYSSAHEYKDIAQFISGTTRNFGAYHIGHLLLEEVSHIDIPFRDSFYKFLELEKLTRHWGQDRSPLCNLFLAELYYDHGVGSDNESTRLESFSEASYHLCKVIELVALDCPFDIRGNFSKDATEIIETSKINELVDCTYENGRMNSTDKPPDTNVESIVPNSILLHKTTFWSRFFWLNGKLSLASGSKDKAFHEFSICLSQLKEDKKTSGTGVFLHHCKFLRMLNVDRVLQEINLLKLDALLGKEINEMMDRGMYTKCINLLAPLLLSLKDVPVDRVSGTLKESASAIESSALDVLMLACEKEEPMNITVYMSCHWRKLQLLTISAGLVDCHGSPKGKKSLSTTNDGSHSDAAEAINSHWIHAISEEVKNISQCASRMKNLIAEPDSNDGFSSLVSIIGDIQSLLLTVICSVVRRFFCQKVDGSGSPNQSNQIESWILIDAVVAFCKLQHLDPYVPVKAQVDLIVAVHDLLAEYGLCCAGRDGNVDEATFLKLAIKHLLALDVKLKSLNGTIGKEESLSLHKDRLEDLIPTDLLGHEGLDKDREVIEAGKNATDGKLDSTKLQNERKLPADSPPSDTETEEIGIDNALDQCFFCLYGLNLNPESSSEDDLALHKNTTHGDYQTKEQSADVFRYILPYAGSLSRSGLVKLRRVLRAIRKHFPQPPNGILAENAIDSFLDGSDLCEDKLCEVSGSDGSRESITSVLFPNGISPDAYMTSLVGSEPYLEVYGNLYYLIAQAEETSAMDKYPGFVLKKEGEEFVEQNASLFKYDLLYNPLRFESWQKLANIYDEEVDLLLNDGSKHMSTADWRKNVSLPRRVEIGRRRSRRCFLASLALASTPDEQSQIDELLALVYYDSLQNVVPTYDQRSVVRERNATWMAFCQNSVKYFEKAFALRPGWLHAFYLGKLCEKMGSSCIKALSYYGKAASLNPSAVDPIYRLHASRLKLLCTHREQTILLIVAAYAFDPSTKEAILNIFNWTSEDLQLMLAVEDDRAADESKEKMDIEPSQLDKAWHLLFDDCLAALQICVEGELKHFHKARYMLAQGLYKRAEDGDMERARDELSFCFKSTRSPFTINMWEIDGTAKKGRRKNSGPGGNKRILEVSLSESSRKFITCLRKYTLFYLNLLEKTGDLLTLERAYVYLRTDKRFYLCLGDIVPVALGKYIQVLTSSIQNIANRGTTGVSLEQMLEKMFSVFMDHVNLWTEISCLPDVKSPDLSENSLYSYLHHYINILEKDVRLDTLEGINEKIRKRFKNPKLSSTNIADICKHAVLAWCRSILLKLIMITPLSDSEHRDDQLGSIDTGLQLFVDLQPDEFFSSEGLYHSKLDMDRFPVLSKIKRLRIKQTLEENMEGAVALMRTAYSFYRESSSGALLSGITLYTVAPPQSVAGVQQPNQDVVGVLDLSMPRKLLLWAYTLVHGRYSNISSVVKYCEENAKSRLKRATLAAAAFSLANVPAGHSPTGATREQNDRDEMVELEDNPSVTNASPHLEENANVVNESCKEAQMTHSSVQLLHRCNTSEEKEN